MGLLIVLIGGGAALFVIGVFAYALIYALLAILGITQRPETFR
jgi:hypothetical protein